MVNDDASHLATCPGVCPNSLLRSILACALILACASLLLPACAADSRPAGGEEGGSGDAGGGEDGGGTGGRALLLPEQMSYSFAVPLEGCAGEQAIQLVSAGTRAARIESVMVEGTSPAEFPVRSFPLPSREQPWRLAMAERSSRLVVDHCPDLWGNPGKDTAILRISGNFPGLELRLEAQLGGEANLLPPAGTLDFGAVLPGEPATLSPALELRLLCPEGCATRPRPVPVRLGLPAGSSYGIASADCPEGRLLLGGARSAGRCTLTFQAGIGLDPGRLVGALVMRWNDGEEEGTPYELPWQVDVHECREPRCTAEGEVLQFFACLGGRWAPAERCRDDDPCTVDACDV
ncbi:MAG: hypothetical protein FJ125_17625, partial [Deltaproteobacteria bacterium]|nr:hypothetical protein [Deltaproteobacteria bacterium]